MAVKYIMDLFLFAYEYSRLTKPPKLVKNYYNLLYPGIALLIVDADGVKVYAKMTEEEYFSMFYYVGAGKTLQNLWIGEDVTVIKAMMLVYKHRHQY